MAVVHAKIKCIIMRTVNEISRRQAEVKLAQPTDQLAKLKKPLPLIKGGDCSAHSHVNKCCMTFLKHLCTEIVLQDLYTYLFAR